LTVTRPIFVVGTGRSGSTVFFDVLAKHPRVAWLSKLSRKFPHYPWLNRRLLEARAVAWIESLLGSRLGPSEAYPFWETLSPGFGNPFRDLTAADVTQSAALRIRNAVEKLTSSDRPRFLAKITGWPRVGFIDCVFADAQFIEVQRDPRATACSLLNVEFWDGWRGPPNWRRGPLPPDLEQIWIDENKSFVSLAAIECIIVQRAADTTFREMGAARHCIVQYSDLCSDSITVYRKVTDFCGLEWVPRFESAVRATRFVNRDDQWQRTLTKEQRFILERTLERAGCSRI
jgi:hypothetical protein